ncbi:hypothetical protein C8Q73DRAFT_668689 [Cubamyces lactineus]|nr:hypothetical protein C8Q73DRAFT_668689 [Cubamyces lactineus]
MQFKSNFVVFVIAAILSTAVSAIPLPGSEITSGTDALLDKALVGPNFDIDVRGRSPVRVLARDPRHGSGSRGRSGSRSATAKTIEARRHGSGSRGRGDSRDRRDLEARRHGSSSRGRSGSRSATVKTIEARRHGSGSRGRGDSRGRRGFIARDSPTWLWLSWSRQQQGPPRGNLKLAVTDPAPGVAVIVSAVVNCKHAAMDLARATEATAGTAVLSKPVATALALVVEGTAGTVVTSKLAAMARSLVEEAGAARAALGSCRLAVTDPVLAAEATVVTGAPSCRHVAMGLTLVAEAGVAAAGPAVTAPGLGAAVTAAPERDPPTSKASEE